MISSQADPASPRNRGRTSQTAQQRACAHQPEKNDSKKILRGVRSPSAPLRPESTKLHEMSIPMHVKRMMAPQRHTCYAEQLRKKSHCKLFRDEDRFGGSQTQMPGQSQLRKKKNLQRKRIIHRDVNTKPARASVHSGYHQSYRRGRPRYRGSRRQLFRC